MVLVVAGLVVAIGQLLHGGVLEKLGVVAQHEYQHGQIAKGMREVDIELVALVYLVEYQLEDSPHFALVVAHWHMEHGGHVGLDAHAVENLAKAHVGLFGVRAGREARGGGPAPVCGIGRVGHNDAHGVVLSPRVDANVLKRGLLYIPRGRVARCAVAVGAFLIKSCSQEGYK